VHSHRLDKAVPLLRLGQYSFKLAQTDAELDQVHKLNYETFVREIAQHGDPGTGRLIDKFHHKNAYLIAMCGDDVVGMAAVHSRPPFSIADRLADPKVIERPGERPLEVRLLAIRPDRRRGPVFSGLIWAIREHARSFGHTCLLISGLEERVPLYAKLGFSRLGPPVPCGGASFVPMTLDLDRPPECLQRKIIRWERLLERDASAKGRAAVSLLPGPVQISPGVRAAWCEAPVSHRSEETVAQFERVRQRLARLAGGSPGVALFCGSGTLANDVVAATLAADREKKPGLILVNGEFGVRLARQARRFGLRFRTVRQPWGRQWDLEAVTKILATDRSLDWVWGVHVETSTGVLNDLDGLREITRSAGVRLCIDGMSSLGAVPLDLHGVHLATACSGKALGAYAGLGIVFAAADACSFLDRRSVPTYLDLRAALSARGPRFTLPSPLLAALDRALDDCATADQCMVRFAHYAELGRFVRSRLQALCLDPVADSESAAPVVTTFAPPPGYTPGEFAALCRALGYEVAFASHYLRRRGLVQIATMGSLANDDLRPFFDRLARHLDQRANGSPRRGKDIPAQGNAPTRTRG
jgi:aspartate aminotransferase-like enzyme